MKPENRLSNKICPEGMSIEEWQVALRREQAEQAAFTVEHIDNNRIWGDYAVSSGPSKYKVAFRGVRSDRNFCSCLDFRTNGLGTCKHLESVILYLRQDVPGYPWADMIYNPPYTSIYVRYKGGRQVGIRIGEQYAREFQKLKEEYFTADGILPVEHYKELQEICRKGEAISASFRCYEDVFLFVNEILRQQEWQAELERAYPSARIPLLADEYNDAYTDQERLLYEACYKGHGLWVGYRHKSHALFVARLAEEIYLGEETLRPGYVLLRRSEDVAHWRSVFGSIPTINKLPIEILTLDKFAAEISRTTVSSTYSFVYVDEADCLKEWKNKVSIAIKRVKINHLYMRLDSLEHIGPVQLSSILQHISPFIIGPFYKFIHSYRLLFPLLDDGSNHPSELRGVILFLHVLNQIAPQTPVLFNDQHLNDTLQDKLKALATCLQAVLDDPDALERLKQLVADAANTSSL